MPLIDSRLGPGTLTFSAGATIVECQITNCRFTPEHEEEELLATLCDPEPSAEVTTSWVIAGTAVQDWEADTGFVEFARTNNNTAVDFEFVPNTGLATVVTYTGTATVQAVEWGGDVGVQLTTDFEWALDGEPVRTTTP